MGTSMHYPCNYGYIPIPSPATATRWMLLVVIGSLAAWSRGPLSPIGMLSMTDEAGADAKLLAVPVDKLTPMYRSVQTHADIPTIILDQIAHFFAHYKDLEPGRVRQGDRLVRSRGSEEGNHGRRGAL